MLSLVHGLELATVLRERHVHLHSSVTMLLPCFRRIHLELVRVRVAIPLLLTENPLAPGMTSAHETTCVTISPVLEVHGWIQLLFIIGLETQ